MYRDNNISASRYSKEERPDWERLQKVLETEPVDVLIMYETSRAWRKLYEWAALVELCADSKVLIHITADGRTYDPNEDSDWSALMEGGFDSEKESRKIRKRVKRAIDANKSQGKPHGRPPYGYETRIDPEDLKKKIRVRIPEQAKIVKEIITRVAKSIPIASIVKDLNERGIVIPSVARGAKPNKRSKDVVLWSPPMIRWICNNIAYIGKVEFEGKLIDATWPPIVDDEDFEEIFWKANNLLKDPERKTTIPARNKYLLSALGDCGECNATLRRRGGSDLESYTCLDKGCVTMRMEWVDTFISELVCNKLAEKDVMAQIFARDDKHLYAEQEALNAELQVALDARAKRELSLRAYMQEEKIILARLEEIQRLIKPAMIPKTVEDLTKDAQGNLKTIRSRWAKLEIPAKKDVIRTLFESIKIMKSSTTKKVRTDEQIEESLRERVKIKWAHE